MGGSAGVRVVAAIMCTACVVSSGCSALENLEREGSVPERTAETARMQMTFLPAESGGSLPRSLEGIFTGEIADGGSTSRFTMDIPSLPGGVAGPDVEFIALDTGEIYYRPLADAEILPPGKEWIALNDTQARRFGLHHFIGFAENDDLRSTQSPPDEDRSGSDSVRGIDTTIYEFSGDLDEMADAVGFPEEQLRQLEKFVGDELVLTMWIDEEGFMRRLEMPFTKVPGFKNVDEPIAIQIELYDYDAEIDIEVPERSKVLKP